MKRWLTCGALTLLALTACTQAAQPTVTPTPPTTTIGIYGQITDAATGRPVEGVCVTIGIPGAICWATTDANGNYAIDGAGVIQPSETDWELYFQKPGAYPVQGTDRFKLPGGVVRKDWTIHK